MSDARGRVEAGTHLAADLPVPELPDVELFRRYLERTALHRRVEAVCVDRGEQLLEGVSERGLRLRLEGHTLASTRRHGKVLFVGLDDEAGALVLRFGMTGFLRTYRNAGSAPPHPRLVLELDDGTRLAYDCQRLLGRIGFTRDPDAWIEEHGLGPDALALDAGSLSKLLAGRRASLKSALMDQHKIAGIGNVYSDEILFRAGLHPRLPVAALTQGDLRRLHRALRDVLEGAIRARADRERVPRTWLLPHREEGGQCPRCGGGLRRIRISGRSAWVCARCQKER